MRYLLAFAASEFVNFRQIEFTSLLELFDIPKNTCVSDWDQSTWLRPYVQVELPDDEVAIRLIERSVLIKCIYQLWCEAATIEELKSEIHTLSPAIVDPYLNTQSTFKVLISSANKKIQQEDKLVLIEEVLNAHPTVNSRVCLKDPVHQLNILLDYEPRNWGRKSSSDPVPLRRVYYGRLVGSSSRRHLMNSLRLADRAYLGNTSMDVRLAGIMANVGLCKRGSLVWDPFIGTGSIVLTASVWGALGAGSDIDYALLHGMGMSPKAGQGKRTDGECLRSSYAQYGLQSYFLDVMVADTATLHRLLRVPEAKHTNEGDSTDVTHSLGLFDAILTDPPYGFRERSRRVAGQVLERNPSLVTAERLAEITGMEVENILRENGDSNSLIEVPHDLPHFPHKEVYPLRETYNDLLDLSHQLLCPNGRLVFWLAIKRGTFQELVEAIPRHPRLRLLAVCEQVLNSRNSRHLITMQKLNVDEPDENKQLTRDQFFAAERLLS